MPTIPERVAKRQHLVWNDVIIAYSLKCGSTSLYAHTYGHDRKKRARATRVGQAEALAARENGTDVWLFVRHPLDRLASCYVFFTRVTNATNIKPIIEKSVEDHCIITGQKRYKDVDFETWCEAAHRHYNAHWTPQYDYHTTPEGVLVPNILRPLEALPRNSGTNASRKGDWQSYYTDEFRERMEEKYANDIWLYEKAKEEWDNANRERPSIF